MSKGRDAATKIIDATGSKDVHVVELDTSSLASVRKFASSWTRSIDILMHNAGIATTPTDVKTNSEGLGLIYATNLAGPFLMTSLLEDQLSSDARVVFTSSTGAYGGVINHLFESLRYAAANLSDSEVYSDTKLMQAVFARALQQRWNRLGVKKTAHAFTPGYSLTEIFDKIPETARTTDYVFHLLKIGTRLGISSDQGAINGVWLATTNEPTVLTGGDFWDRMVKYYSPVDLMPQSVIDKAWQTWCSDTGAEWS